MPSCATDPWWPPGAAGGDPHVVIAMSGGVDSSVAAMLIKKAGYRCSALFMKNWNEPSDEGSCHWEDDVADALAVCEKLDIPLNTIDLSADYWDRVFSDFLVEYGRGRTPNPDVLCNREIKFRAFIDAARTLGGDLIATGHYVRRHESVGQQYLLKGADPGKDQSYFLYTLGQAQIAASLFPVGHLEKTEVRRLAREAGLENHKKKDSTGICFIGERRFREFLGRYVNATPGPILSDAGERIGTHGGAVFYTLGQREGLGIGGVRGADAAPWFVVDKDLARNALVVAQGHDHPRLMKHTLLATDVSWVSGTPPTLPLRCTGRTRYRQAEQACEVNVADDTRIRATFDRPQRAMTPGQSVVFYAGDRCLGGGIIDEVH